MAKLSFMSDVCKGCGLCVEACPKNIIQINEDVLNSAGHHPVHCIDESSCIACASCAVMCPDCAIIVEKESE